MKSARFMKNLIHTISILFLFQTFSCGNPESEHKDEKVIIDSNLGKIIQEYENKITKIKSSYGNKDINSITSLSPSLANLINQLAIYKGQVDVDKQRKTNDEQKKTPYDILEDEINKIFARTYELNLNANNDKQQNDSNIINILYNVIDKFKNNNSNIAEGIHIPGDILSDDESCLVQLINSFDLNSERIQYAFVNANEDEVLLSTHKPNKYFSISEAKLVDMSQVSTNYFLIPILDLKIKNNCTFLAKMKLKNTNIFSSIYYYSILRAKYKDCIECIYQDKDNKKKKKDPNKNPAKSYRNYDSYKNVLINVEKSSLLAPYSLLFFNFDKNNKMINLIVRCDDTLDEYRIDDTHSIYLLTSQHPEKQIGNDNQYSQIIDSNREYFEKNVMYMFSTQDINETMNFQDSKSSISDPVLSYLNNNLQIVAGTKSSTLDASYSLVFSENEWKIIKSTKNENSSMKGSALKSLTKPQTPLNGPKP